MTNNYTLLNVNVVSARISKKFKIISFFIIFTAVMCFYYAKRNVDSSDELDKGINQLDNKSDQLNYKVDKNFSNKSDNNFQNEFSTQFPLKINKTFNNNTLNNPTTKFVLFWTRFFNNPDWVTGESDEAGAEILKSINCPITNCFFTHNHSHLNDLTQFDAIAFHTPEFFMPIQMPRIRSAHQLYIMASLE